MKNILITGATGFIGKHVVDYLLKHHIEEYELILTSRSKAPVETMFNNANVIWKYFDISALDPDVDYFDYFNRPDKLIHLAWEGLPNYKALFHFEENLPRHTLLLKNLISNGLSDVTVTGTCLEYGMQEGQLSESLSCFPDNSYALAKDCFRKYLVELHKVFDFSFKWVRLFYMFGDGQNKNSLFSQLSTALNNNEPVFNMSGGEQVRDYLPVEKVAEYLAKISLQTKVDGIINCGSGQPVTLSDQITNYLEVNNKSIQLNKSFYPYNDYEPMKFWADTTKLKTILNQ